MSEFCGVFYIDLKGITNIVSCVSSVIARSRGEDLKYFSQCTDMTLFCDLISQCKNLGYGYKSYLIILDHTDGCIEEVKNFSDNVTSRTKTKIIVVSKNKIVNADFVVTLPKLPDDEVIELLTLKIDREHFSSFDLEIMKVSSIPELEALVKRPRSEFDRRFKEHPIIPKINGNLNILKQVKNFLNNNTLRGVFDALQMTVPNDLDLDNYRGLDMVENRSWDNFIKFEVKIQVQKIGKAFNNRDWEFLAPHFGVSHGCVTRSKILNVWPQYCKLLDNMLRVKESVCSGKIQGFIGRLTSKEKLKSSSAKPGTFIIRWSSQLGHLAVDIVISNNDVTISYEHILIYIKQEGFCLKIDKTEEFTYPTLQHLIECAHKWKYWYTEKNGVTNIIEKSVDNSN